MHANCRARYVPRFQRLGAAQCLGKMNFTELASVPSDHLMPITDQLLWLPTRVIARVGCPKRLSPPTATLLDAMGLAPGLEGDVATVALAYQPYAPVPPEADAAADRLAAACGGRTEEAATRVCVLVQAHAATLALIARLQASDGAPAVPATPRITPDGREILVDLVGAPFGAGRHACRGQALALHLAGADTSEPVPNHD